MMKEKQNFLIEHLKSLNEKDFKNLKPEDIVFQDGGGCNSDKENFCIIKGKYYCKIISKNQNRQTVKEVLQDINSNVIATNLFPDKQPKTFYINKGEFIAYVSKDIKYQKENQLKMKDFTGENFRKTQDPDQKIRQRTLDWIFTALDRSKDNIKALEGKENKFYEFDYMIHIAHFELQIFLAPVIDKINGDFNKNSFAKKEVLDALAKTYAQIPAIKLNIEKFKESDFYKHNQQYCDEYLKTVSSNLNTFKEEYNKAVDSYNNKHDDKILTYKEQCDKKGKVMHLNNNQNISYNKPKTMQIEQMYTEPSKKVDWKAFGEERERKNEAEKIENEKMKKEMEEMQKLLVKPIIGSITF